MQNDDDDGDWPLMMRATENLTLLFFFLFPT